MKRFESALEAVNPALRFPSRNNYIATKFDLKPRETMIREHPHVIHDDPWCRIWFKQDDEYNCPKAVTRIALISPMMNSSPKSSMLAQIYASCFRDALTEVIYNAMLAGVYCDISSYDFGLAAGNLNVQEVEAFGKEMFRAFSIEFFIHGNTTEQFFSNYLTATQDFASLKSINRGVSPSEIFINFNQKTYCRGNVSWQRRPGVTS
ncbi:hypothetical protein COOONC_06714 [Cooperia oncophora]